ncbi:MAG: NHL repeat-containing protein [Deltaproteobacteria bacterium]|nr:NHL repeat-containing protein [Deltaproteobacteria bacterium]
MKAYGPPINNAPHTPRLRTSRAASGTAVLLAALIITACPQKTPAPGKTSMGAGSADSGPSPVTSPIPAPEVTFLGELSHPSMKGPARIAVSPNGDIVVADPRAKAAHVFSTGGAYKFRIKRLVRPLSCAVGADKRIYIGDKKLRGVFIFDALGNPLGALGKGEGEFRMPNAIAVDREKGTVYVVDSKASQVRAFSTEGSFKFNFGSEGSGDGQFAFPTGIVFDPARSLLYVASHNDGRILVFSPTGTFLKVFGSYGAKPGSFSRAQGMALDTKGRLYVADAFQTQLQLVDTNGSHVSYLGQMGKTRGKLMIPLDATFDAHGRLLVASYDTGKVLIYGIDSTTTPPPPVVAGDVQLIPNVLDPASRDLWVTAYIEVPERSAASIAPHTVRLHLLQKALSPDTSKVPTIGDHDKDGVKDLTLRFSRRDILALIEKAGTYNLRITGELSSNETFAATVQLSVRAASK